jgi:hypothetical protein
MFSKVVATFVALSAIGFAGYTYHAGCPLHHSCGSSQATSFQESSGCCASQGGCCHGDSAADESPADESDED